MNCLAYLVNAGVEIEYNKQGDNLIFGEVEDTQEVAQLIEDYKADRWLHSFLNAFKVVRVGMKKIRY